MGYGYNDYEDLKSIDEVINQVRQYGTKAWIWDGDEIKSDAFVADIFPILEALKAYEIDMDEDTFNYIMANGDGDNTYNWGANISNDISFHWIKNQKEYGAILMVHLSGDVRGNYSSYFAISNIDNIFYDIDDIYQYKSIDDRYEAEIHAFSEYINIYDQETNDDLGECYDIEREDILTWIEENS